MTTEDIINSKPILQKWHRGEKLTKDDYMSLINDSLMLSLEEVNIFSKIRRSDNKFVNDNITQARQEIKVMVEIKKLLSNG